MTRSTLTLDMKNLYENLDSAEVLHPESKELYKGELPTICGVLAGPNADETSWDNDFDIKPETLHRN